MKKHVNDAIFYRNVVSFLKNKITSLSSENSFTPVPPDAEKFLNIKKKWTKQEKEFL